MADDGVCIVLVFLKEIIGAREGYLVDILVNLGCSHANAAVAYGDGVLAHGYVDRQIAHFALEIALGGQSLEFLGGIYGI